MSQPIDMREAWNRTSHAYQALHQIPTDTAHYGPWAPTEADLGLLGDVRGQRILELGCGGGQCSIAFARQGAVAMGIDLSEEQLAYAGRLAAEERVDVVFVQGDASDLSCCEGGAFDIVFSSYALHYVADIERCLSEVSRVLVPGGRLVFSLDHPFWDCFFDEEEGEDTLLPARSYFRRGAMEWQFSAGGEWMRSFHRTIGDWVAALHGAGLRVEHILEPEPALGPETESTWGNSYELELAQLIPQTVIFVARRGGE